MSISEIKFNKKLSQAFVNSKHNKDYNKIVKLILKKLEKKEGYVVIRGIKISNIDLKKITSSYIFLMKKLGELLPQNKKKEKIVKVENLGKSWSANNRGYKTKDNINFHSDGGTYADFMGVIEPKTCENFIITVSEKVYDY